jgi:hypothetical protein
MATRGSAARRRALLDEADAHPGHGVAQFLAAVECWEQGDLANAHRLAERVLVDDPHAFRMLIICADFYQRAGDRARTLEFAKRLLAARNPSRSIRRIASWLGAVFWVLRPSRSRVWRQRHMEEASTFDEWVNWAHRYVEG